MPYMQWTGIDISGEVKRGVMRVNTVAELDAYLLINEIGLMSCSIPDVPWYKFSRRISLERMAQFFDHLASLVEAGILLPQALLLMSSYVRGPHLRAVVYDIALLVRDGMSYSDACMLYPRLFSVDMCHLIKAGQRSGKLGQSLRMLAHCLQMQVGVHKALRAALMVPGITCIFFIVVLLIVLIGIVPAFSTILQAHGAELPQGTRYVLWLSEQMQGISCIIVIGVVSTLGIGLRCLMRYESMNLKKARLLLMVPGIGSWICHYSVGIFSQTVALLCVNGVPLIEALDVACRGVSNVWLRKRLEHVTALVLAGVSFDQACAQELTPLFWCEDLCAFIKVGLETGMLGTMMERVGFLYTSDVQRRLMRAVTIIQPLLMIVLGVCVAGLIFAVYVPLFNMPGVLQGV